MPSKEKIFEESVLKILNDKFSLALRQAGEIHSGGDRFQFDLFDPDRGFYVDIHDEFRTEQRAEFIDRSKALEFFFSKRNKPVTYCLVFNQNLSASDTKFLSANLFANTPNISLLIFSYHELVALKREMDNDIQSNKDVISKKTYRLGKVSGELNIGMSTIVNLLAEEGVQVDLNPNSKLDPDSYLLVKRRLEAIKSSSMGPTVKYLWVNYDELILDEVGAKATINLGATKITSVLSSNYSGQAVIYPIEPDQARFVYVNFTASDRSGQLLLSYEIIDIIQTKLSIGQVIEHVGKAQLSIQFDILSRVASGFSQKEFNAIISLLRQIQIKDEDIIIESVENVIQQKDASGRNIQNEFQKTIISNDTAQSTRDLLGFENDIRAFAALIALKEMKPPLAIGLFGKWGSGKSFFMHNLQDRINYLSVHQGFEIGKQSKLVDESDKPFCEGVVHVTFNAWSYMDANLWASLVATIFEELDSYISGQKIGDAQKEAVRKILNNRLSFASEEKIQITRSRAELFVREQELIDKALELQEQKNKLEEQRSVKNYSVLLNKIIQKFDSKGEIDDLIENHGIEKIFQLSDDELKRELIGWKDFWRTVRNTPPWMVFVFILGVVALGTFLLFPQSLKLMIASGGILGVIPGISYLLKLKLKIWNTYRKAKEYRDKVSKLLLEETSKIETDILQVVRNIEDTKEELNLKQRKVELMEIEIQNLNFDLENSVTKQAFFDFISSRSKDDRYQQNLSLISLIRKDFQILSELFNDYNSVDEGSLAVKDRTLINELLNKPLDRIVLYVDDLDRCSEDRVVEVLEAVNLLMAYPLFVVVVGVDPRWVKNALIKRYSMQFTGQLDKSGHKLEQIYVADYLEKIFQIPFHLYQADDDGNKRILEDILGNQIKSEESSIVIEDETNAPIVEGIKKIVIEEHVEMSEQLDVEIKSTVSLSIRPKDLKISRQELDDLQHLSWLAGNNPRTLKRYANIYRIVRVHEDLNYDEDSERDNFLVIMFLIGLSVGPYKHLTNDFYDLCEKEITTRFSVIIQNILEKNNIDVSRNNPFLGVPENLKKISGFDFLRYIEFVKRFSF